MGTILHVWELGAGSGHVMHSASLVKALIRAGHRVLAALRDPAAAVGVFDLAIELLPAPLRTDGDRGVLSFGSNTFSFARILHNTAFGDDRIWTGLGLAWRNLFNLVKPELVLFDHAPAALFASRGFAGGAADWAGERSRGGARWMKAGPRGLPSGPGFDSCGRVRRRSAG